MIHRGTFACYLERSRSGISDLPFSRSAIGTAALFGGALWGIFPGLEPSALAAQSQSAAREIVQPLPPRASGALNRALRELARNPRNIAALLRAGDASLELSDAEAASGFFTRAREVDKSNRTAMLGLARAQLGLGRPVAALRLFSEAENAGTALSSFAADKALAYDLVGDGATARRLYAEVLDTKEDAAVRRRLALSHAIDGNKPAFERELFAQLERGDRAAFRARTFGLAILDEGDEAIKIAEAMMPTDLALRMAPYLRFMPRLTKAQQAAAANLGVFPRAANIGRDSASIAQFAAQGEEITAQANAALTPSGPVLGSEAVPSGEADFARPGQVAASGATDQRMASAPPAEPEVAVPTAELEPTGTQAVAVIEPSRRRPDRLTNAADQIAVAPEVEAEIAAAPPASVPPASADLAETASDPVIIASQGTADTAVTAISSAMPADAASPERGENAARPASTSVADAFGDFSQVRTEQSAARGNVVDIATITPPREVTTPPPAASDNADEAAEKAEEKPEEDGHPARHWVQIATGPNRSGLPLDWARLTAELGGKLEGKGPFTAPWEEAHRLLAGPYDSLKLARQVVSDLKASGLDSFAYTSPAGQAVTPVE